MALRISSTLRRPRHPSGPATAPRAGGRERRADMQAHISTYTGSRTRAGPPSTQRLQASAPLGLHMRAGRAAGAPMAERGLAVRRAVRASRSFSALRGASKRAPAQDTRERRKRPGAPAWLPACTRRRAGRGALGRLGAVDGREQAVLGRRAGLRRGPERVMSRNVTKEHGATCSACTGRMRAGVAPAQRAGTPAVTTRLAGDEVHAGRCPPACRCRQSWQTTPRWAGGPLRAPRRGPCGRGPRAGRQGPRACGTTLGSTLAQGQPLE